jgi:hypothetical protein
MGKEAHAIFLNGTGGLKVGARFPLRWMKSILDRLCSEFEIGKKGDQLTEGKGKAERGLDDLTGFLLPPSRSHTFIIEPRLRR